MNRYLILFSALILSTNTFGQVGIETGYPKGALHIDGNKDNPKDNTSTITSTQESNDVIISQNTGNVGVGLTTPSTKLDINNGTVNGAIRIKDGTQGNGKYLMSDANGLARWETPNSFNSAIYWKYDAKIGPKTITLDNPLVEDSNNSNIKYFAEGGNSRQYSNLSLLNVTKGKWIVNIGIRMKTPVNLSQAFWLHANLSSKNNVVKDNTGWVNLGPAGNPTGYASVIYGDGTSNGKGFLTGTTIIEVTAPSVNLYFFIENTGKWTFDTSYPENYFYAIPIN